MRYQIIQIKTHVSAGRLHGIYFFFRFLSIDFSFGLQKRTGLHREIVPH